MSKDSGLFAWFDKIRIAVSSRKGAHSGPLHDLVIYDDCYPHPMSGFRTEEFTTLLSHFTRSKAVLSGFVYHLFGVPGEMHLQHIQALSASRPELGGKLYTGDVDLIDQCRLFYCVFLNNICRALPVLERKLVPFVFTLYPGGGFCMENPDSDAMLQKVFSSPMFRKVIVTQQRTYDYLIDHEFCKPGQILFVFGVVVPQVSLKGSPVSRKRYPEDKKEFCLCFCGMRYTDDGADKGYPLFIAMMKSISGKYSFLRFHVIGNFDADVLDVRGYEDRIVFHGAVDFGRLREIFQQMDMIISPNQPNRLKKGAFDGFPLGTVVEAALNGVAVMLTDVYQENRYFEHGKDLLIISPVLEEMICVMAKCLEDPESVYQMASSGQRRFQQLYSNECQMKPRIELLESLIGL